MDALSANEQEQTKTRANALRQAARRAPRAERPTMRALYTLQGTPSVNLASRSVDVIASTESLDAYDRLVVQDWKLDRYLKNPVVLWNHGEGAGCFGDADDIDVTLPIGFASNVRVEGGLLKATLTFVDEKANPIAEKVYQGFAQGSIRAVSCGWDPTDVRMEMRDGEDVFVVSGNELVEISAVAIPANPDTVAETAKMVASLRARAHDTDERESPMGSKMIAKAAGLPEDSSEEAIALRIAEVVTASGASTLAGAVGAIAGMRERIARGDAAVAELASVKAQQRASDVHRILGDAKDEGKIDPSDIPQILATFKVGKVEDLDPEQLRPFVAMLQPKTNRAGKDGATDTPSSGASDASDIASSVTARDRRIAKANGWKPEDLAAHRARYVASRSGRAVDPDDEEDDDTQPGTKPPAASKKKGSGK